MIGFIVIGKYVENINNKDKITAYKVYDIKNNKSYLVPKEDTANAIKNGTSILGLRLLFELNAYANKALTVREDRHLGIHKVDTVDSKGNPINSRNTHVVYGIEGFGENRVYVSVNSSGEAKKLTQEEIVELASTDTAIGVSMRGKHLYISKHIKQAIQEC